MFRSCNSTRESEFSCLGVVIQLDKQNFSPSWRTEEFETSLPYICEAKQVERHLFRFFNLEIFFSFWWQRNLNILYEFWNEILGKYRMFIWCWPWRNQLYRSRSKGWDGSILYTLEHSRIRLIYNGRKCFINISPQRFYIFDPAYEEDPLFPPLIALVFLWHLFFLCVKIAKISAWFLMINIHVDPAEESAQWTHNLCRNPDASFAPYCYVDMSGEPSACLIPRYLTV